MNSTIICYIAIGFFFGLIFGYCNGYSKGKKIGYWERDDFLWWLKHD